MSDPNRLAEAMIGVSDFVRHTQLGRLAAGSCAVVALWGATEGRDITLGVESAAAANVPTQEAEQFCFQAGKVPPTPEYAYMINPGQEPYEKNSRKAGQVQEIKVSAHYPAMPEDDPLTAEDEGCEDLRRLGLMAVESKEKGQKGWRNIFGRKILWWIYSRQTEGSGGVNWEATGHEGEEFYWEKGTKYRVKFVNKVTNMVTGKKALSKPQIIPLEIRR